VHQQYRDAATNKAIQTIHTIVAKVHYNQSLTPLYLPLVKRAMVIGGGIAGLQTSLDLADRGRRVLLVEREPSIGGKMIDDRFPFWFADTAYAETWSFVTGEYLPILPITVASKPGRFNPRLRDMGFWWDFYVATRGERVLRAEQIRRDLGITLPPGRLRAILDGWEARDKLGRPGAIEIAKALPEREPDAVYLSAYRAARHYMRIAA
jgi:hypothetical protein